MLLYVVLNRVNALCNTVLYSVEEKRYSTKSLELLLISLHFTRKMGITCSVSCQDDQNYDYFVQVCFYGIVWWMKI